MKAEDGTLMPMKRGHRYVVDYERDEEGAWTATVHEIEACYTYGRSLDEARRRVPEAIAAATGKSVENAKLDDRVKLPRDLQNALDRARELRGEAQERAVEAAAATREAVRVLTTAGLSVRDVGLLLGISGQGVHKLLR